jgi:hypothetical protein
MPLNFTLKQSNLWLATRITAEVICHGIKTNKKIKELQDILKPLYSDVKPIYTVNQSGVGLQFFFSPFSSS